MSINGGSARTSSTTLTVDSAVPGATQMRLGRKWKSVYASYDYTMLHAQDGPVEFAGYGSLGAAGDGSVTFTTSAFKFGGKTRVWADYAAGGAHSVALAPDGTLWTWGTGTDGFGGDGELGLLGTTSALQPINITPECRYTRVFAGLHNAFAIRDDGTLWAWGRNTSGELGDGTTTSRGVPVQIGADTDWSMVSNWGGMTLALKSDGTLWAWGPNASGQLGLGDTAQRLVPTRVGTATGWRSISAALDHALAVASDGSLWAWGYNGYGQLGDGTKVNKTSPFKVSSLQWKTIETGIACSFGVRQDGTLWAWGDNFSGQLGDGTTTERVSPVRIGIRTDWELVSSGGSTDSPRYNWRNSSVGTTTDGRVFTWGDNTFGRLGDGTSTQRLAPVEITRSPLVAFAASASLSAPWASGETTIHASYSDSVGNVTWLSDMIFVMPAAPVIYKLMPYEGLVVESSTPEISAHVDVSSGGMPATVEVRVDGVLLPSTYDAALTHVVRAPTTGLSDDSTHTVEIKVTDAASTVVTATASFLLEGGTRMLHWDAKPDCRTCHGTAVPHDLSVVTTGGEPRCIICHMGKHNTSPENPSFQGCNCHTSGTDIRYLNWTHKLDPAKCRTCHAKFSAGLEPARLETVRHSADTTACKPCHRSELRFEHVLRKTDAGVTLTCATCHATTAPAAIKAAVLANDTRCATCHPGVDHWPLHDEPPLEPACASCHKANLLDEHVYRGVLCDTCHLSTNTVVAAAIAARDGSCAACHGSAAGPNHTFGGVPPVDKTKCATCHWSAGTVGATLDSVHKHASPWLPARSQCVICHKSRFDVTTGLYGSPAFVGPYGTFASVESTTASADSIHSAHMNGSHLLGPSAGLSYCNSCHAAAACDACHITVTHGDHTRNAITGVYGALPVTRPVAPGVLPGATVNKTVTTQAVTCIAAKCHAVAVDGTLAKKPLCSDCH
ncbi:MAG: hypothetical protein Q8S43_01590 [Actinomycetota bacterium]|nr:hypothetical protein [Actinomycetota bacterium]